MLHYPHMPETIARPEDLAELLEDDPPASSENAPPPLLLDSLPEDVPASLVSRETSEKTLPRAVSDEDEGFESVSATLENPPAPSPRSQDLLNIQDATATRKGWEDDQDIQALEEKIATGHYSVRDMFLWKCLHGNDKLLVVYAKKMLRESLPAEMDKQGFGVVVIVPARKETPRK